MKDAVVTVRLPQAKRRRLEELARREGRSLSSQIERLLDRAMTPAGSRPPRLRDARSLAGILHGGRTPTLREFRELRSAIARSLGRRSRLDAELRR
jgi:hypothetical protein